MIFSLRAGAVMFHTPEELMEMVAPVCYIEPTNTGKEPRLEARMENSMGVAIFLVIRLLPVSNLRC